MMYFAYHNGVVGVNQRRAYIVFFCETFVIDQWEVMNDIGGWKGGEQDLMLVSAVNTCSVVLWWGKNREHALQLRLALQNIWYV